MSTTDTLGLQMRSLFKLIDKVDGLQKEARAFLEYGKEHEGYWTAKRFLSQLEVAVKIANIKYPKEKGYRVCFVFDHSSYHGTLLKMH